MIPFHSIETEDNLFLETPWNAQGFVVVPFLSAVDYRNLCTGITQLIVDIFAELGVAIPPNFQLKNYHLVVGNGPEIHLQLIERIRSYLPIARFPIDAEKVTRRISEVLGFSTTLRHPTFGVEVFSIRIVRPFCADYNPLHRDVWLDRLRHAVNLYAPLCGSNERSSLPLVPGSHFWSEDEITRSEEGYWDGQNKYSVPALISARRPLDVIRPNPAENEAMLFSPYLLHGGATNSNPDETRVSLEMRFWRRNHPNRDRILWA